MTQTVDLVWLGGPEREVVWPLGTIWRVESTPVAVQACIETHLAASRAQAWLFWDAGLGDPSPERILAVLSLPGDVWHAGLQRGMRGLPRLIDSVIATSMFNRDPDPTIEATSWRVSLQACVIRTDVLRQLTGVDTAFKTLGGAALEMGHRFIMQGVLTRHVPWLVPEQGSKASPRLPFEDELRFVYCRFGRFWSLWALGRALLTGYVSFGKGVQTWRHLAGTLRAVDSLSFQRSSLSKPAGVDQARVSVLIPTLDRYPYLRTLLQQLREQSIKPLEIIVVDQTPVTQRDTTLKEEFADLPLRILYQDRPGQCSSRNAGLQRVQGEYILFMDDDNEVGSSLIEQHVRTLYDFQAEVSCGVSHEVGVDALPKAFTLMRASDVFPTNNTLIRKEVLEHTGLFDLAFERGNRADGDLGMRVYLSGAVMVLNPDITVLHHHAPRGGLRVHKARVITYASSRSRILHRHLPSVTEMYLARRYYNERQVREMLWLRLFETFSIRGKRPKKLLKLIVSFAMLPDTLWKMRRRYREAIHLLEDYPQIPVFTGAEKGHPVQTS